jgi:hypothetical protein
MLRPYSLRPFFFVRGKSDFRAQVLGRNLPAQQIIELANLQFVQIAVALNNRNLN